VHCRNCDRFLANISALQSKILALPDAAWSREYQAQHNAVLTGRTQNMDRSVCTALHCLACQLLLFLLRRAAAAVVAQCTSCVMTHLLVQRLS
jgi:hypothetical protein